MPSRTATRNTMTIGALAREAQISVEAVRFYQRKGLLPRPHRPAGGVRRYGADALGRARFIKSAQRLGFSLDEIGHLLHSENATRCEVVREKGLRKLADVKSRIAELQRIEAALSELVNRCVESGTGDCCPLIESLRES